MNRHELRWLNEYLDGEIGLADKAELERRMGANPELRGRYKEMRQAGLLLAAMPEVNVHPYRFRQRVLDKLDQRSPFLSPQRAFAGAMVVALLVLTLSFSMLMFQSKMLGEVEYQPMLQESLEALQPSSGAGLNCPVLINSGVDATQFISRLMVEDQLGMIEPAALLAIAEQTDVLENAVCTDDPLTPIRLAGTSQMLYVQLEVAPSVALQLSQVAESISGRHDALQIRSANGNKVKLEDYLRENPNSTTIPVQLMFEH